MNRRILILLLACALAAVLCGCGDGDAAGAGGSRYSGPTGSGLGSASRTVSQPAYGGGEASSQLRERQSGLVEYPPEAEGYEDSYPACSSLPVLLEDILRMGDALPQELPLPDEAAVQEALGASYSSATCRKGVIECSFFREMDLDALAARYSLPAEKPETGLVLAEGLSDRDLKDWRSTAQDLVFTTTAYELADFPQDGLAWEEAPEHEGFQTIVTVETLAGEPVRRRVRWFVERHLLEADLPEDCMGAFWENPGGSILWMETGADRITPAPQDPVASTESVPGTPSS